MTLETQDPHELWAQWTYDLKQIDWEAKRESREE